MGQPKRSVDRQNMGPVRVSGHSDSAFLTSRCICAACVCLTASTDPVINKQRPVLDLYSSSAHPSYPSEHFRLELILSFRTPLCVFLLLCVSFSLVVVLGLSRFIHSASFSERHEVIAHALGISEQMSLLASICTFSITMYVCLQCVHVFSSMSGPLGVRVLVWSVKLCYCYTASLSRMCVKLSTLSLVHVVSYTVSSHNPRIRFRKTSGVIRGRILLVYVALNSVL